MPLWEASVYTHHQWLDDTAEIEAANRQTNGLVGIVVILLLLVGGLFLVQQLRHASLIQDCIMAGRSNCEVIVDQTQ
jgi:hypothetical protein